MQLVGRRYVRYVKNEYGRSGTLREGRVTSSLIQREWYLYLLACGRYLS